jgi:hypothetical protein
MKQRVGFVSNSSSSSFVLLGYKMESKNLQELAQELSPEKCKKLRANCDGNDEYEELLYDMIYGGEMFKGVNTITDDSTIYLGVELCHSEDWGIEFSEHSIRELTMMGEKIQGALRLSHSPRVYTGTRAC